MATLNAPMSELQLRIQDRKKTQLELATKKLDKQQQRAQTTRGAERAFFFLKRDNPVRKLCLHIATSKLFDAIIISAIIANSIIIGLSDFNVVDSELNPASHGVRYENGELVSAFSMRNYIVQVSEMPFTVLFATEATIKIIAFGFVVGHGTYLHDSWNQLDFFVVLASLISILPQIPNVSVIRTIRVLRPLRSLSMIPGMRRLISALLKALPALGNVLVLQLFVFAIFGILGIQLFGGNMNRRCRLTEFAIKLPMNGSVSVWPVSDEYLFKVLADPESFRCLDAPMLDDGDTQAGLFSKESSPWNKTQDCFWPIDEDDGLLCVVPGVSGNHMCATNRTCGANFDTYGNPRFSLSRVMDTALFNDNNFWGFPSFDNIGRVFLVIMQIITMDAWTALMYQAMDTGQPIVAAVYFVVFVIVAVFFVMNLLLAVISDEFNIEEDMPPEPTPMEQRAMRLAAEAKLKLNTQRAVPRYPRLYGIVSHPVFSNFIMVVIVTNTVVLSLDHHPMPAQLDSDLEIVNFGLSCVFLLEMVLKLVGLGFRQYAREKFNVFDAFVVTMSVLETIATPPSFLSGDTTPKKGAVSALRSFRLFRVFKLARNWRSLRELLELIGRAVASIANFGVLLVLFIYIYALIGLQFFANTMRFDADGYRIPGNGTDFWEGDLARTNFDTLLRSSANVLQIISGEDWNHVMYGSMRGTGMAACAYSISVVIFGTYIMMNLFLALLLDDFDPAGGTEDDAKEKEQEAEIKKLAQRMASAKVAPHDTPIMEEKPHYAMNSKGRHSIDDQIDDEPVNAIDLDRLNDEMARELDPRATRRIDRKAGVAYPRRSVDPSEKTSTKNRIQAIENTGFGSGEESNRPATAGGAPKILPPKGKLFFILSETNPLRQYAYRLIIHPWFDSLILTLIVISSISLALDNPLARPDSTLKNVLAQLDTIFAGVFMVEMVAKILALGLLTHEGSYLRNGWNILDCTIVISSILMLVADSTPSLDSKQFKSLRSLRGLRTFRPLRMISRRPGMRLVVSALFEAIPAVLNVLFLCMLLYLIFSIIAVNYLKGLLYACQGDVFDTLSDDQIAFLTTPSSPWSALTDAQQDWFANSTCMGYATLVAGTKVTSRYICECWGAQWDEVIPENFNNVGNAMLTFFEISTTEGWVDLMTAVTDTTDIDMQPIQDNAVGWTFFFMAFIMIGSYFVVNLFVGVIIDNFNKMKEKLGGNIFLSEDQKKWLEARKAAMRVVPVRRTTRPKHKARGLAFDLVKKQRFEWIIMLCIIVNTVLMGIQYFGQPTRMTNAINIANEIFAAVFTIEAVLKILAFGRAYFDDTWNKFDFFVVIGTLFSIVIESLTGASVRSLAMLVRVFRVTRIVRLIKASKNVRQILLTLYIALPGLSNVTSILFLMLFIYATMGVQFFAKVKLQDNIDVHANFQDFWTGFLFLLRAATGEAWNGCMHDLAVTSDCIDDPPYNENMCGFNNFEGCIPINGCGSPIAYLYFCSFTLLVTYVMLNLTIAVILEGFNQSQTDEEEQEEPLFEPEMLEEFQLKWAEIDINATGYISIRKIRQLITLLEEPLGRKDVLVDKNAFIDYIRCLKLPVYEGDVLYFKDVLLAMTGELVRENDPDVLANLPPSKDEPPSRLCMDFEAHEYYAMRVIEKRVHEWLREKREMEQRTMEEYKSKIKKPSGRPKKVRDARVYTLG